MSAAPDAHTEGYLAFNEGLSNLKCPYEDCTFEALEWTRGWRDAQIDNGRLGVGA